MNVINTFHQAKLLIFILTSSLLSCGSSTAVANEDLPLINFDTKNNLSQVLDRAEEESKLVFIDFYADWCLPCKVMDDQVYSDKATADFLNENFINYKVNGEKGEGPDLNIIYNVKGYPTQLFLDSKGRVVEHNLGSLGLVGFNVLAERALAKSKEVN